MNKQSGRIGLYLVLIVALIAGYLYLNNQVAVQSDYTYGQLEQAVTDGKVTSATIHQNSEVPTGSVIVNISGEGQKRIYVADVNEAEQLLGQLIILFLSVRPYQKGFDAGIGWTAALYLSYSIQRTRYFAG